MAVGNLVRRLQDIMRKDAGINGDAQRIEQMVWMFFLKVYDAAEEDWEIDDDNFKSIIPEELRWRRWAPTIDEEGKVRKDFLTAGDLLKFVNDKLFPVLQGQNYGKEGDEDFIPGIKVTRDTPRHKAVVHDVFGEVNQYMKNGVLLRQMINEIEAVDLLDSEESHQFGDMYETLLKDLQAAGNAGEFYTPRPLTDFTVEHLDPKLGELMGDLAAGTGGFIISTLKHLEKQKKTADDEEKYQHSVMGQEWKPFPYLLGVTNIMLHGIKDPEFSHMDSLGKNMSEYQEEGKLDTIAMNPPYGGATDAATKMNFKAEYRSSETADLFMVLIMQRLNHGGRAGVVVPDGFLFGTEGAKLAIKRRLLQEFNLHTIIRLPGSVFSPYTGIATNILFFNNERADGAPEGFSTKETWFYRMDMPEGYKHFNKTRPILNQHFDVVNDWWQNRQILEEGEKSRSFTPQELMDAGCNFDQCKFPKEEEEVLRPKELLNTYHELKDKLNEEIESIVLNVETLLDSKEPQVLNLTIKNPCNVLANLVNNIPERLKKSILQEAIEGRLVSHDPNDKPAYVLLNHIREEKKRLVKEGKLKKKDLEETPISDNNIPFMIPRSWKWVRLEDITTYISRGKSPVYSEIKKYPIVAQKCNQWTGFSLEKAKFADPSTVDKYAEERLLLDGDLLWNSTGLGTLGRMAIYDSQKNPYGWAVADSHVTVIRTREDFCDYKYLFYYFASYEVQSVIEDKSDGSTKQKELYQETVRKYEVPLPPLSEQHRIVEKIEQLFGEIDKLKGVI